MELRSVAAWPAESITRWRRSRDTGPVSRRRFGVVATAVAEFLVSGLLALLVVGLAQAIVAMRISNSEAISDARNVTEVIGRSLIEPVLADGVLTNDPAALASLDNAVRQYLLNDRVVRVKIWTLDGRIVYSDEPRLIGFVSPLGAEDLEAVREGRVAADISDLSAAENVYERDQGKLLEVYMPLRTSGGQPVLFELYLKFNSIADSSHRIWRAFLPVILVGLLLLSLAQAPLAWSFGRRIWRGRREREALLHRALEASDSERRRIASGLHDGIIQELAGLSYTLAGVANRMDASGAPELKAIIDTAAAGTRQSIRELRQLLMDIYPPSVHGAGLEAALTDMLAAAAASGLNTSLEFNHALTLGPETEGLVFRVAREAIQNVRKHSGATNVAVRVFAANGHLVLTVEDNGKGFAPAEVERRREEGHFGLRLVRDLVSHGGGRLSIESAPGDGARIRLEVRQS